MNLKKRQEFSTKMTQQAPQICSKFKNSFHRMENRCIWKQHTILPQQAKHFAAESRHISSNAQRTEWNHGQDVHTH